MVEEILDKKYIFVLIQLINFISLILIDLLVKSGEISFLAGKEILCYYYAYHFIWALYSWYAIDHNLFNPYILFFIGAFVFNGGQFILELFGANEIGLLGGNFSDLLVYKTILFTSLGLTVVHLGALLTTNTEQRIFNKTSPINSEESILAVGLFLLAISIVPAMYVMKNSLQIVLSVGYFGLFQAEKVTGLASAPKILVNFLTPASIFILAGGKRKKIYVYGSMSIVLAMSALYFFFGDRSGAVMPLMAYFWVWHKIYKPIPTSLLIFLGSFLMFVVFPLVSLTRNLSGAYRLNLAFLKEAFLTINNPIIAIIYEMGRTAETVAHTLRLIPDVKDYEMGRTYFYGLYSLVPNFFAKIHPAKAYGTPSDWLIWHVNPYIAKEGGGLGYSFIAEAYLNFAWWGGLLYLFVFGFLLGKLTVFANNPKNIGRIVFVGAFFAFLIKYTRGDIFSVARPLLWYALIPIGLAYFYYYFRDFIKNYFWLDARKTVYNKNT